MTNFKVAFFINDTNADYYRYLKQRQVRLQCCDTCGFIRHPARWLCPECLGESYHWKPLSGRAKIESFVWYMKDLWDGRYTSEWSYREVPYNVALVKLVEGPTLVTNIDDVVFQGLRVGQAVKASFVDVAAEYAILRFVPDE